MDEQTKRTRIGMSGLLFGLGLGGFFDGIVLHQILQWHHMVSNTESYPPTSLSNMEVNVMADGFFHAATYIFVLLGLITLWTALNNRPIPWSTLGFIGAMLTGWGIFNLVEGVVDHHLLGVHRVNETVPASQMIYWDIGFLVWGAIMLIVGWLLWRVGFGSPVEAQAEESREASPAD